MSRDRPEHIAPAEIFYSKDEAQKYSSKSRNIKIQTQMSERAIELLALPDEKSCLILDIGCGAGLSGEVLEEKGHNWIGVDISQGMLDVAKEREVEGDVIVGDMGQGMCFRAGTFDGAISISAVQWLCNADKRSHRPAERLRRFFSSLYSCLTRGSRAVFQFYPKNSDQLQLITEQAQKSGFDCNLLIDFPNSTKAKKYFLVLMTGGSAKRPEAIENEPSTNHVQYVKSRIRNKFPRKSVKSARDWILEKKERRRRQGKDVRPDSIYTGRKRSKKF